MDSTKRISKKIALLGSHAVGKTSLISRFVEHKFPENYMTTIGLKVDKKTAEIGEYTIDMVIWDIAGQDDQLSTQIGMLKGMLPKASFVIAANKKDLLSPEELAAVLDSCSVTPDLATSAKTGELVDELFLQLGAKMIEAL